MFGIKRKIKQVKEDTMTELEEIINGRYPKHYPIEMCKKCSSLEKCLALGSFNWRERPCENIGRE